MQGSLRIYIYNFAVQFTSSRALREGEKAHKLPYHHRHIERQVALIVQIE